MKRKLEGVMGRRGSVMTVTLKRSHHCLSFTHTIMVLSSLTTARKRALSDGPDIQSIRKKIKNVNGTSDMATSEMEMDSRAQNVSVYESRRYS